VTKYRISTYRTLVRTSNPPVEPITLDETKTHLRIDHDDDDNYIEGLITAAREYVEALIDRTIITTEWRMTFDAFPFEIILPRPPVSTYVSAVTVTYKNAYQNTITLPSTEYRVDRLSTPGVIRPPYEKSWPPHLTDQNSVTVEWYAGYGTTQASIPRAIKHALLMLVGHYYERRLAYESTFGTVNEVPHGFRALLSSVSWGSYQ
jgi:uncharacterized phiE125 gp8 family phage protein